MAIHSNLTALFSDIADSIRGKTGGTDTIVADEFPEAIDNIPTGGGTKLFTGHYDAEGLKTIGYTDEEIQWYQDNCVFWNEEDDDIYKLTEGELAGDTSTNTRYYPRSNSYPNNFQNYRKLITIPSNVPANTASKFLYSGCVGVKEMDANNNTSLSKFFSQSSVITSPAFKNTSGITNMSQMFYYATELKNVQYFDTSNVTNMNYCFYNCGLLSTIPQLITSKVENFSYCFFNVWGLITLPELDFSSATNIYRLFTTDYTQLRNVGGFKDLGKAYDISAAENYSNYTLQITDSRVITEQSLINILNDLYDIAAKGCNKQKIQFGRNNISKLTSAAGVQALADARAKGWNVE